MRQQFMTTLVMGLAAATLCIVAAICYPWPRSVATGQQVRYARFEMQIGLNAQAFDAAPHRRAIVAVAHVELAAVEEL